MMTQSRKPMKIWCDYCDKEVDTQVLGSYTYENDAEDMFDFSFLRCSKCNNPMLICQELSGGGPSEPEFLYPSNQEDEFQVFPKEIRHSLIEAFRCHKFKLYTASVVICGKVLEGIYYLKGDKRFRRSTLEVKLIKLRDANIIDHHLYDWADALRITRNKAAHDVLQTFDFEDSRDVLEFTHAICEYVFTLRDKFEEFKNRRGIRNQT